MKIKLSLSIAILLVLSLVLSCSSTKTSEPEVVEVVEETIQEEPIKAELKDNYLYINNHRVDVYLNGGTLVGDAKEILEKANADGFVTMPEVKKDGYKFLGWYDLDTDSYDNRRNISLSEFNRDTKFQASFDLDMSLLDISFEEEGRNAVIKASHPLFDFTVTAPLESAADVTLSEVLDEARNNRVLTIPEISMKDYIFLGWKEYGSDTLESKIDIDLNTAKGSKAYKAYFTPDLSKAVFEMGIEGGNAWFKASLIGLYIKVSAPKDSFLIGDLDAILNNAVETKYLTLPTLERKGYVFKGWRKVGSDSVEKNPSIDILAMSDSLEYEAVFEKIVYSITYDELGVIYEAKKEEPIIIPEVPEPEPMEVKINPDTYTIEDSFTLINPERVGYTFMGWIVDGEESYSARVIEEVSLGTIGNINYKAVWLPNTYNIELELNDGTLSDAPTSFVFDSPSFTLPLPEKKDYVFLGWQKEGEEPEVEYLVDTKIPSDLVLSAVWTPKEYFIEYNQNIVLYSPLPEPLPEPEVVPENPSSYTVLDSFTLINPTLDGYTFAGWIEDGEESYEARSEYSLSVGSSGDRKLSAVWIPNEYYISYDFNGGEIDGEEPEKFVFNEESPVFVEPVLDYYVFQGWVDDEIGGEPFMTLDTTIPGDKNLKAVWKPYEYVVDYDLDGGEFSEEYVSSYTIESETFTTANPVKNGYEFIGWTVKDDSPSCLFSLSLVKDSVRTNLNAFKDHLEIYTSLFDKKTKAKLSDAMKEAGITGVMENGVLTIQYREELETDEALTLVYSVLNGTGIFIDATYYGSKAIVPSVTIEGGSTGDVALKAIWKVITYYIDYDEDGVIFGSDLNRKAENACWYTVESAFQVINPEKKGYDFVGWILEGEPTSKARSIYEFSKGTTGDKNLVAVWKPCEYSIKLDTKGGKIDEYPSSYFYLDRDYVIPTPEKKDYVFLGWKVDGDNSGNLYSKYTIESGDMGDVTLEAVWEAKKYYINYDLNGGNLAKGVENPSYYTVLDKDFALANPTRFGYTFLGWTENPYATYTKYSLRYTVMTDRCSDINLTATWAPIEYSITYDLDGGRYRYDNSNPTKYTIESDGIYLANPVKDGYTFLGWITGGDRTETLRKGMVLPPESTGNVKFFAIWEKDTVPVGEVTKKQIDLLVYGKDGIPRPDWMVKLPTTEGYHYEKASSSNPDLFEALKEATEECRKLMAQWASTKYERADKSVDGTEYLTNGVEYSNRVQRAEMIEYWEDNEGHTWVLLRVAESDIIVE